MFLAEILTSIFGHGRLYHMMCFANVYFHADFRLGLVLGLVRGKECPVGLEIWAQRVKKLGKTHV